MAIIGMLGFSLAFAFYLCVHSTTLPLSFADNWEIVANSADDLLQALPVVQQFLELCRLPISASKCWVWAITAPDRRSLRGCALFEQQLPVKLQAKELGVDISYSLKRAAFCRNQRVEKGLRRLVRVASLPCSVWTKTRLLLSSVLSLCTPRC